MVRGAPLLSKAEDRPLRREMMSMRRARRAEGPDSLMHARWWPSVVLAVAALAVLGTGSYFGNIHSRHTNDRLAAGASAVVFLVLAVLAVRAVAGEMNRVIGGRAGASAGSAVRLIVTFAGYVVAVFVGLGLLDVPVQHLLIGGALTGVVLGIALQQVLGNMFAGIVLLFVRPFVVGDRIRLRSGSFGGPVMGTVTAVSLTYVSLAADDGPLRIPNSVMLATAVGPAPTVDEMKEMAAAGTLPAALAGAIPPPPTAASTKRSAGQLRRSADPASGRAGGGRRPG